MVQLTIWRLKNRITAFELSGHADSGPPGHDLVCAGVSAVSFGTVNAVFELCGVELKVNQGEGGGYLYVTIPHIKDRQAARHVQILLEGMLVSMETIERDYSRYITIMQK